jgi:hypothetical protein
MPWTPWPGPQAMAYLTLADELYYGGAAGGGKTALAVGLALTQHRNSLILRRQSVDTKGIVEYVKSLNVGSWKSVGYGGELKTDDGRLIEIGGCQHNDDWQKYAGRPHDFLDFDELPQFTQHQYTMISAWNRVADPVKYPRQRCRVIGGGNPPLDPEGEWVLKRWRSWIAPENGALAAQPGELRWFVQDGTDEREVPDNTPVEIDGRLVKPRSRTFIPARLEDNPALLGTGYDTTLDALPEPIRSALRRGDMSCSRQDDRWQLIPTKWVVESQRRWLKRQAEGWGPITAIGCDPARGGADATALAHRHGWSIAKLVRKPGKETPDGQSVVRLFMNDGSPVVNIDTIGLGSSVYDAAKMLGLTNCKSVVVSNSTKWADPKTPKLKFANVRAAMMWKVRHLLDPEGGAEETRLALPPDSMLLADLTAPRYKLTAGGVQVESKEDIRRRIGRSTDVGDAVGLACWDSGSVVVKFFD